MFCRYGIYNCLILTLVFSVNKTLLNTLIHLEITAFLGRTKIVFYFKGWGHVGSRRNLFISKSLFHQQISSRYKTPAWSQYRAYKSQPVWCSPKINIASVSLITCWTLRLSPLTSVLSYLKNWGLRIRNKVTFPRSNSCTEPTWHWAPHLHSHSPVLPIIFCLFCASRNEYLKLSGQTLNASKLVLKDNGTVF